MVHFVAFLRGINVGGHTAKKETLQQAFKELGFLNVDTYKQSGNVVFDTPNTDEVALAVEIEEKLKTTLGFNVPVFLRTIPELNTIIKADRFKGQNAEGTSFLVTFLKSPVSTLPLELPATIPKSSAQVISMHDREVFSVTHGGGEGAQPNPYIEKTLKTKTTTRNLNIIQEIMVKYGRL
jgi:uncharacterized protein (DUF1697 family)